MNSKYDNMYSAAENNPPATNTEITIFCFFCLNEKTYNKAAMPLNDSPNKSPVILYVTPFPKIISTMIHINHETNEPTIV